MEYREGNRGLRMKFDEDEINYDRWRPGYPDELFQAVAEYAGLERGMRALEVGIGTGQATRPFLEAGCRVTAVELGEKLAAYSQVKFQNFFNLEILQGDFMKCPLQGDSFDLLYSATAFHWIPEEQGYPKALRLLKSGGTLAVWWNHPCPAPEQPELFQEIQKVYGRFGRAVRKSPVEFTEENCAPLAQQLKEMGFSGVESRLFHSSRSLGPEEYCGLLNTYSDHRAMEENARAGLMEGISSAIMRFGGRLELRDPMDLYLARKP